MSINVICILRRSSSFFPVSRIFISFQFSTLRTTARYSFHMYTINTWLCWKFLWNLVMQIWQWWHQLTIFFHSANSLNFLVFEPIQFHYYWENPIWIPLNDDEYLNLCVYWNVQSIALRHRIEFIEHIIRFISLVVDVFFGCLWK